VPEAFRAHALREFERHAHAALDVIGGIRPLDAACEGGGDRLRVRTIFPFRSIDDDRLETAQRIYSELSREIRVATTGDLRSESSICKTYRVGQPVAVANGNKGTIGALRISAGSRIVTDAYDEIAGNSERRLQCSLNELSEALERVSYVAARLE
jgi:hypothetical protein